MTVADHDKIQRRVAALLARATHPGTAPPEAAASQAKADALIRKYGSPPPLAPTLEPKRVHLMSGFTPSGASKWRACCWCGFRTTPRATRERALRALGVDHALDVPECVLCGITYPDADWMTVRNRLLVVLDDPYTGGSFASCRDMDACQVRREAEKVTDVGQDGDR